jgi:hypothetical protein
LAGIGATKRQEVEGMNGKSGPGEGTKRARMTFRQRWHRGADGMYRYAGVCPFNNIVCKMMNAFAGRKQKNEGE